ncbi:unnamed protein product, partial [Ectocarpus sp. 12 AP-2014]
DEWRLEYLKGLNAGFDNQKAKDAADKATGRTETKPPPAPTSATSKPSARSSPPAAATAGKKKPTHPAAAASAASSENQAVPSTALHKLHLALTA